MSFGSILKEIRKKHKDSLRGLAEKMEISFSFIDKIEKNNAPVSKTFFEKVISVYTEEKEILTKAYINSQLPEKMQNENSVKILKTENILNLPVYGKVSAGFGCLNFDAPIHYMPITKGTFSEDSFFVEITGNSMNPTLEEGEFALVDPHNLDYVKNKIYVVTYCDEGYIKRLEVKEKLGIITLKSDNPEYDDIDIPEEMQEYFKINGRVVKVVSVKKI